MSKFLPPSVQRLYHFDLYDRGGADHDLLDRALAAGQTVSGLQQKMQRVQFVATFILLVVRYIILLLGSTVFRFVLLLFRVWDTLSAVGLSLPRSG